MDDREHSVQYFLDLIKKSHRGKFKVYIGMIAGVGKSYRMLQEAHELLENGVNVQSAISKLMDAPGRKHCCKGSLSFRVAKSSIRGKNWKKWIWIRLSVSIRKL